MEVVEDLDIRLKLGVVIPTNKPDVMMKEFVASAEHLLPIAEFSSILISFQHPWTESKIDECVSRLRNLGFEVRYQMVEQSTFVDGDDRFQRVYMSRLREITARLDPECDVYVLLDDDCIFSPGSEVYPRGSGRRYLEALDYMSRHPKCGVLISKGFLGGYHKQWMIDGFWTETISTNRGLFLRNMSSYNDGFILTHPEGMDLTGGLEESLLAFMRIEVGMFMARQMNNPTIHATTVRLKKSDPLRPDERDAGGKPTNIETWIRDRYSVPDWNFFFGLPPMLMSLYSNHGGPEDIESISIDYVIKGESTIDEIIKNTKVRRRKDKDPNAPRSPRKVKEPIISEVFEVPDPRVSLGMVMVSSSPEDFFVYMAPTLKHLSPISKITRAAATLLPPWDKSSVEDLRKSFENVGIPIKIRFLEYVPDQPWKMGLMRDQCAAMISEDSDVFLLVEDTMRFQGGTPKYPRSSGQRYLEVLDYFTRQPKCGIVQCGGFLGAAKRGYTIVPVWPKMIIMNKGLFVRNMEDHGFILLDDERLDTPGALDEMVIATLRILHGYYHAKQSNVPTVQKKLGHTEWPENHYRNKDLVDRFIGGAMTEIFECPWVFNEKFSDGLRRKYIEAGGPPNPEYESEYYASYSNDEEPDLVIKPRSTKAKQSKKDLEEELERLRAELDSMKESSEAMKKKDIDEEEGHRQG